MHGTVSLKNLHLHVPIVLKSGASIFWNPQGLFRALQGMLYLFFRFEPKIAVYDRSNIVHVSHCRVAVADTQLPCFIFCPE